MRFTKKALSVLMSVALVAGLCPGLAFASPSRLAAGDMDVQPQASESGTCGGCD